MSGRASSHDLLRVGGLLADYAYHLDHDDLSSLATVFAEDAELALSGQGRSVGRIAIMDAYTRRRDQRPRTARHIYTNIRAFRNADGHLGSTAILLLFAADGRPPLPAEPLLVADCDTWYEDGAATLLIRTHEMNVVFIRPAGTVSLPLDSER